MPEPDCFFRYHISDSRWNFTLGKSDVYVLVAAARHGFKMVLQASTAATRGFTVVLFTEAVSRRNTFVGGTCAPPSTLLVLKIKLCKFLLHNVVGNVTVVVSISLECMMYGAVYRTLMDRQRRRLQQLMSQILMM